METNPYKAKKATRVRLDAPAWELAATLAILPQKSSNNDRATETQGQYGKFRHRKEMLFGPTVDLAQGPLLPPSDGQSISLLKAHFVDGISPAILPPP